MSALALSPEDKGTWSVAGASALAAHIGLGLLIAAGTGAAAWIFGYPLLTSWFRYIELPVIGAVPLASALVFDLVLPHSAVRWGWFLLSVVGAAVLASRWWFLVSLSAFWVIGDVRGILQLATTVMLFGTGNLVPLQMLPDGIETVARWLPFAAMLQFPGQVLLGTWSGPVLLVVQAAWILVLHTIGRLVFRVATRRLVIDGG